MDIEVKSEDELYLYLLQELTDNDDPVILYKFDVAGNLKPLKSINWDRSLYEEQRKASVIMCETKNNTYHATFDPFTKLTCYIPVPGKDSVI